MQRQGHSTELVVMEVRRGRERALQNIQTHFKAKARIFKAYQDMGMPCTTKRLEVRMLLLLLSRFSRVRLCATPQTAAHQAPPSLGFSRQEHWSGLPFPQVRIDAPKPAHTPVFIAALFTIAKTWKQPKCPSTEEWIKRYGIYRFVNCNKYTILMQDIDNSCQCDGGNSLYF